MAVKDIQKIAKLASGCVVGEEAALTTQVAAAPAGGTGATAGAYDSAANRDIMIAAVNNNRTRIAEIEAVLQKFGLIL